VGEPLVSGATELSPPPLDHHRHNWGGGSFETARRPYTRLVHGRLAPGDATLMVTLHGGAEHHELITDDGYRYSGPDRAGSTSFLPAGCARRLTLKGVAWKWASITLRPDAVAGRSTRVEPRPFSAGCDNVVLGLLAEMERLHSWDGRLDASYCDAISLAITEYVCWKYWSNAKPGVSAKAIRLPSWQLRRVFDYINAHLGDELRIADIAGIIDLSEGHFHRAFRATTGDTPLAYITSRRVQRACHLLAASEQSIGELAAAVGFVSQSHFARTFRAATGLSPRIYRKQFQR
jgi:AraC family transcriptional regulator